MHSLQFYELGQAEVLYELFLSRGIRKRFLNRKILTNFKTAILANGRHPIYLDFFIMLLHCEESAQKWLVEIKNIFILGGESQHRLLFTDPENGRFVFTRGEGKAVSHKLDVPFFYQARLIELMLLIYQKISKSNDQFTLQHFKTSL